ncbi:exodeoxyribonuclease V subunit beta [Shewanella xiamenensis]|uniref:exodeoxyribonuclease V subunit beta n=1 Tax=Shewanella xiamenensis TaxID=332186 RepID=UPI0024A6A95C|nr:exodeoxyribonuclease V subunit beta [Shewanella xiamenensis]MDI5835308.1 exodeoxyribonuclease V subunit beta [Shewanella xiamenensis]MDI5839302.1 exodeoxyribonuclease V subunit beta [Shewanella xiamenensis]MDI5842738.1 exodeoxyribonuclease V subunit beta [Shewanella xiamenensis]MDI5849504.1 exodeoxyribonuclease V subunit beta [Shewanella xiamenensis]MDI5850619.1 exodeoxyribonuclease V subunit beta [Shewanella xiamenensis]
MSELSNNMILPTTSQALPLDPLTLPFGGSRLIEASAGTGKTYTISGLYLRLLLGDGLSEPLSCEQILVVTFTNAATEELRDRIRRRIQVAFKCFLGLEINDPFVQALYDKTPESERAIALRRFDLALKSLDEAAIFTIHGFCQRILADLAFESSLLFESDFTLDDSEFLHHAVRDFWREACYPLPEYLAQIIASEFGDPDGLVKQLRALLGASEVKPLKPVQPFARLAESLSQSVQRFKLAWPRGRDALLELLHSLPLNGQRFGKASDNYPKLAEMFDQLDNFLAFGHGLPPLKVLESLSLSELKLNKGGVLPSAIEAPLLDHMEQLATLINAIKPAFLFSAKQGISERFAKQKQLKNVLTPDDLLTTLAAAMQANPDTLPKAVASRFPVALIDEFQDTDPLQFAIFSGIYQTRLGIEAQNSTAVEPKARTDSKLSLLMIGDPKQAIYAFRGADIYTYIEARRQTQAHYFLDTNYRSSRNLVTGVNHLFAQHPNPFISQSIPFDRVKTPASAAAKLLVESTANSAALRLKLLRKGETGLNKASARQTLAEDTAAEITRLLTEAANGQCHTPKGPLIAKDIAILVRDRNEAAVMKTALSKRQIGAVFLSRDSVFDTVEAREMALILRALASPKDERALRSALATALLGYSAEQIHAFNQDEEQRQMLLEQFFALHQIWQKRGIMPALLSLANATHMVARLLQTPSVTATADQDSEEPDEASNGERRLTDFRHLAELLQQKATEIDGISALLNWYEQQLIDNTGTDEQQLRLESEQNLVQIVTIHKSKGLEYPVCFIPFVSLARDNRRRPTPMLYHRTDADGAQELVWDIEGTDEGWEQAKQETLAEDLRLLYVALTRPVYLCYLYIANHSRMLKAGLKSQLHETAIGYLLGVTDADCDFARLHSAAQALLNGVESNAQAISVECVTDSIDDSKLHTGETQSHTLNARNVTRQYRTPWRVGSYSGLVKNAPHAKASPGADDEVSAVFGAEPANSLSESSWQDTADVPQLPLLNRFSFERGANAGSFMHLVLELIDFTQAEIDLPRELPKAMLQYGIAPEWQTVLQDWYMEILQAPLALMAQDNQLFNPDLCLAALAPQHTLVEMEFYLPLNRLKDAELNQLLGQFGYDTALHFDELQGMLKGFIDLTFEYQGQFYIADYKSNHLGDTIQAYHYGALKQAISDHRYDLQYILYSLALHRYLAMRLPNYDYDTHIGGCYYLFLRGMSVQYPGFGVYYDKPPKALILALDALFNRSQDESHMSQHNTEAMA